MAVITAKFTADVGDFRAKLQTLVTEVTGFDRTSKQVAADLRKFGNDFSGANTIRQFESMAQAVDQLGGTTRLTATEVSKLGTAATEALAKYQALGQQAPADIQRVADAAIKLKAANDAAAKSASPLAGIFSKIGGAVTGAFTVGAVLNFGKSVIEMASEIHDLAEQTGLSTDAVQEYKYAAEQTGTSLDAMVGILDKMSKNLQEGGKKTVDAVSALKQYGITLSGLQQMSPDEAFTALAGAIKNVTDEQKQLTIAQELFGKGGAVALRLIKEGFVDLRKEAHATGQVLDEISVNQLEAFGDKWGRLMTTMKVSAAEASLAIGKSLSSATGIADFVAGYIHGGAGGAAAASLGSYGASVAQPKAPRTGDISLASPVSSDYIAQLQQARAEIAKFTPEMRAEIAAATAMGESNDKIAQSLSRMKGGFDVSTQAIDIYAKAQKEATKLSPEKAFTESAQKASELAVFIQKAGGATAFSREQQDEFNKTLFAGAEAYTALKRTGDPSYDLILKQTFATANWAKELGPVHKGIEDIIKGMNALPDASTATDIAIGAYAKLDQTADQAAKTIRSVGDKGVSADQAYVTSLNRVIDAYHSFGLVSTQELQRAAIASQQNYQILLASGTATTAQLRIAYEQMIYAQVLATGKIPSVWQTIAHDLPALFGTIANSFADNLGKMLTGQESFKDGFLGIWHDIQKQLGNILSDIVSQFERGFISNITSALLGGGSVWGGIIQSALSQGVRTGATLALAGGSAQAAGGLITNAAYGTGAQSGANVLTGYGTTIGGAAVSHSGLSLSSLSTTSAIGYIGGPVAGGIVGFEVGKATGSKLAGAAAGAGTGAAVGAFAGPIGAGVGAGVGALAGLYGAHRANEDARDSMVAVRSQLEQTFGSLDKVRQAASLVGVNIDQAFQDIGRGVDGVDDFNKVVGKFQDKFTALDGAMKRYGITIDELTTAQKSSQEQVGDQVKQLESDFKALTSDSSKLPKDTVITKMADSFNALLIAAKDSGSQIPAELEPILDRMVELGLVSDDAKNKLLGIGTASSSDLQKATDIANKYGISLAQLGPSFEQAQISGRAKEIIGDFTDLKALNVDVGGSLAGMSDEISQFIIDAKKAGAEVPENMRDILQELVNNKQLIDENGNALTDLSSIKFGAPLADQFQPVTDAIHELIDVLTGKSKDSLPGALQDGIDQMGVIAKKSKITIPVGFDIPNLPDNFPDGYRPDNGGTSERPMAAGGVVWGPTHVLAGEAGPEVISPLSKLPELLGPMRSSTQPIVVESTVYLDGSVVARSAQRHWSRELRASGAAR